MSAVLVNNSLLNDLIYNLGVPIDTVIILILIYYINRMMHSLRCALVSFCSFLKKELNEHFLSFNFQRLFLTLFILLFL